jgi:hypothetical protein
MARCMCNSSSSALGKGERRLASTAPTSAICWQRRLASSDRQIGRLTLLVTLIISLCVVSFGGDIPLRSPGSTQPVAEIPFRTYEGYLIVVDGRIGHLEHQNLLLDTGSNPSMIDRSVSATLGLQGTSRDLSLFNKSVAAECVSVPELQFGPMRRHDLLVVVTDFSAISRGLGIRIDAVVGLDVLGGTNFTVDYAKRRIFFGASTERHTTAFTAGPQFITVNLKSGRRQLHLLLDTGTPQLILFESHIRGMDYVQTSAIGFGQNASGNVRFGSVVLPQVTIGTFDVGPQRASVVANRRDMEGDLDGLMGLSCLRPKRISFDFERQVLGWSD